MMSRIPESAKPHEVAILMVYYGMKVQDPLYIANLLHYKTPHSVYRTLKKHRQYIANQHCAQQHLNKD